MVNLDNHKLQLLHFYLVGYFSSSSTPNSQRADTGCVPFLLMRKTSSAPPYNAEKFFRALTTQLLNQTYISGERRVRREGAHHTTQAVEQQVAAGNFEPATRLSGCTPNTVRRLRPLRDKLVCRLAVAERADMGGEMGWAVVSTADLRQIFQVLIICELPSLKPRVKF